MQATVHNNISKKNAKYELKSDQLFVLMNKWKYVYPYDVFLTFTDVTEIVDETVEEEECKTIEEEMCSQPTPQFGEKCQDVQVS